MTVSWKFCDVISTKKISILCYEICKTQFAYLTYMLYCVSSQASWSSAINFSSVNCCSHKIPPDRRKGGFFWIFMYDIQHCFICRLSQFPLCRRILGSNPGQLRLRHWLSLSDALTYHSARSHPKNKCLTFLPTQILRTTPHSGVLVPRVSRRGGGGGDHSDPHRELERQSQQVCPGATRRGPTNRPDPPCHHLPSGPVHCKKIVTKTTL